MTIPLGFVVLVVVSLMTQPSGKSVGLCGGISIRGVNPNEELILLDVKTVRIALDALRAFARLVTRFWVPCSTLAWACWLADGRHGHAYAS